MGKARTTKISILAAAALALCSCADLWQKKQNNDWPEHYVWEVAEMAKGVLYNAYYAMPSRPDSYGGNFLDAATDNALTNAYGTSLYTLCSGDYSISSFPLAKWSACYRQFQYIHSFLENGLTDRTRYDKVDAEQDRAFKKRLEGEAYFLRAWWGWECLRLYGGKTDGGEALGYMIVTSWLDEEKASDYSWQRRNTYEECVAQICEDLDRAAEILPESYSGADPVLGDSNIGLPTALAAGALKSRVLLYAASPAYRDDSVTRIVAPGEFIVVDEGAYALLWERAALYADALIRTGRYTPARGLTATDLSDSRNRTPDEFLFRFYFNSRDMEQRHFSPALFGKGYTQPSANLVEAFPGIDGYPLGHEKSTVDPSSPYEGRDRRLRLNVIHHGARLGNHVFDMTESGADGPLFNSFSTQTGYYLAKFMSSKNEILTPLSPSNSQHYFPLLRKTEVLLNYAEAANEAWGPEGKGEGCAYTALEVLNHVRRISGGIEDTSYAEEVAALGKDAFRTLVHNERRIELAFENHRYFDLRRWLEPLSEPVRRTKVTVDGDTVSYDSSQVAALRPFTSLSDYYAPIHYDECVKNPNLVNNLGWK